MHSGAPLSAIVSPADSLALDRCAAALRAGALVGLPTETVYGLAADADNPVAVASIFAAKGRPADHPLIVHVAAFDGGMSGVSHYAERIPAFARQLMAAFWPGPLTLILPRRAGVAAAAAGGQDSIGVRCPAHPAAQALLGLLRHPGDGVPAVWGLAAPSANRFGKVSPTSAAHVQSELSDRLGAGLLILDGGACAVGIESTIIDCTRGVPVLLRPGGIGRDQIAQACGCELVAPETLQAQGHQAPRASGTLASHYAPSARVRLLSAAALQQALEQRDRDAAMACGHPALQASPAQPQPQPPLPAVAVYARSPLRLPASPVVWRQMPSDAAVAAHELFSVLRELDAQRVSQIWVETPPEDPRWDGVRDRLQRAAA